jgi:hypothetical protein
MSVSNKVCFLALICCFLAAEGYKVDQSDIVIKPKFQALQGINAPGATGGTPSLTCVEKVNAKIASLKNKNVPEGMWSSEMQSFCGDLFKGAAEHINGVTVEKTVGFFLPCRFLTRNI